MIHLGKMAPGVTLCLILLGPERFVFKPPDYTSSTTGGPAHKYNHRCLRVPVSPCLSLLFSLCTPSNLSHLSCDVRVFVPKVLIRNFFTLIAELSLSLNGIADGFTESSPQLRLCACSMSAFKFCLL